MKNAYLKNLSGLLAKDGVGPENTELVLSWTNYQPLHLSGNLNRAAFDKIMENDSSRLISFIFMNQKLPGNRFDNSMRNIIVLLKNDDITCVNYGIYYVS